MHAGEIIKTPVKSSLMRAAAVTKALKRRRNINCSDTLEFLMES